MTQPRAGGAPLVQPGAHRHKSTRIGYVHVHSAVDAYSRVAYSEILDNEKAETCAGFWRRAHAWFAEHGINVQRVLTDNAWAYCGLTFEGALGTITHSRIRPYRPQTNGKVERFNRTLLDEWAYVRLYRSDAARARAFQRWLHLYNHHRAHTSLGGQAPMQTLSNLPDQYN